MKAQYFPGKLLVLTNEYFNKQKQIKTEGNNFRSLLIIYQDFLSIVLIKYILLLFVLMNNVICMFQEEFKEKKII